MYRSPATKRLLPALFRHRKIPQDHFPTVSIIPNLSRFFTSSSTSTNAFNEEEKSRGRDYEWRSTRTSRPGRAQNEDEQAHVLRASLHHVIRFGWSEAAMIAGAKEVGVSPSIVGAFPRKEAALVEFFMDECLQKLIDIIDSGVDLKDLIPSACVAKLVRIRLEMEAPYIPKWPRALSIQAQPDNIPTSFKQRAMLIDEIWHAAGDDSTDIDWYVKRTILGGIYSSTELYMLTDESPDYHDTWNFLDGRIRDAFDRKNSVQEAKYLAEAVSEGMGGSLQGLFKKENFISILTLGNGANNSGTKKDHFY